MQAKSRLKLLFLLLLPLTLTSQVKKEKSFKKSYALSNQGSLVLDHKRGPLTIKNSTDGKVTIDALIMVAGKDDENVDLTLELMDIQVDQNGDNLIVSSGQEIKSWNTSFNRTRITFKNGGRVEDIKDIEVSMIVYVPDLGKVSLSNKYDNIYFDNLKGDYEIDLYDGRIDGGNIEGDLIFNTKYSKGKMGNISGKFDFNIYDSDINFGNSSSMDGEMKYSDCDFGESGTANLDIYDSDLRFGSLKGVSRIKDKYSEIILKNCPDLYLDVYDSKIEFDDVDKLDLITKYTDFIFGNIKKAEINSYDDNFRIGSIQAIEIESKYSDFDINSIESMLTFNTHDDELDVEQFGSNLQKIDIDGKYAKINLNISPSAEYQLEAITQYGSFVYPESKVASTYYKERNSEVEVRGSVGSTETANQFKVDCYDCKIKIE